MSGYLQRLATLRGRGKQADIAMKPLNRQRAWSILFWSNIVLLLVHVAVESKWHILNWRQTGERVPFASNFIEIEGFLSMALGLAIFEKHYPSMKSMVLSKELRYSAVVWIAQITVWFFYV